MNRYALSGVVFGTSTTTELPKLVARIKHCVLFLVVIFFFFRFISLLLYFFHLTLRRFEFLSICSNQKKSHNLMEHWRGMCVCVCMWPNITLYDELNDVQCVLKNCIKTKIFDYLIIINFAAYAMHVQCARTEKKTRKTEIATMFFFYRYNIELLNS